MGKQLMSENAADGTTRSLAPSRIVVVMGLTAVLLGAGIVSPLVAPTAADSGLHVSLDPTRDEIDPGETVQIGVTVRNDVDTESPAPVLAVDELPAGWSVESWSGAEATYRNSTNEWLWMTIDPGERVKFTITISVPADDSGEETIGVVLSDGGDRTAAADTTITVAEGGTATNDGGEAGEPPVLFEVPGFGFQAALVALLITSGFLVSNRSER